MKEENPHLPQRYLKVVEPLQGYIRKLSNGERGGKRENHTKLMISWVVWAAKWRITPNLWSHKWWRNIAGRKNWAYGTYDLGGNLQSTKGEKSLKLLSSRLWIFHARVRRRGLDEAVTLASTIVSTAVIILINMTSLACFFLVCVWCYMNLLLIDRYVYKLISIG